MCALISVCIENLKNMVSKILPNHTTLYHITPELLFFSMFKGLSSAGCQNLDF